MPTPHNEAKKNQIAKTVLMPGDPLRAQVVAETYLENVKRFNTVRNMFGFTGTYKGRRISVMGSGMGMPSIGIYAHELYEFYGVENIIRIGSAGGLDRKTRLKDIVIGMGACTDSNFAAQYQLPGTFAPIADYDLLETAVGIARAKGVRTHVGNILSSDHFYVADPTSNKKWQSMGILAIEMESAALYMIAAQLKKRALGIFTVSDLIHRKAELSAAERQNGFNAMMEVALDTARKIS